MLKSTFVALLLALVGMAACQQPAASGASRPTPKVTTDTTHYGPLTVATFASGCFWCVEAIFESLTGVKEAVSGYSGGRTKNPTYEEVCTHTTGHTETVQVFYDSTQISYATLLEVYFASQDPTQVNGQGPDKGDSYRSVIFYHNDTEKQQAEAYKQKLNESGQYSKPIAVIIEPFKAFYEAEAYHQNFERNNPNQPYVRAVSVPRLNRMKAQFPKLLKTAGH
jgi:peptide-methionine (S)-S-oxide reductase